MANYTLAQYETLCAAISDGTRRVKYQDKEVEYRSLEDMRSIRQEMELELGLGAANATGPRRVIAVHSKGL